MICISSNPIPNHSNSIHRICTAMRTNIILRSNCNYKSTISNYTHKKLVWEEFAVDDTTLTWYSTLHFPILSAVTAITIIHLLLLHQTGSNNPLGLNKNTDKIPFHPYFTVKDILRFALTIIILTILTLKKSYILGGPNNFTPANPLVTWVHIQPEWYFLFPYAILQSIPNKLEE